MAPDFSLELPYLSIGIAKVGIFSLPANFSAQFYQKSAFFVVFYGFSCD